MTTRTTRTLLAALSLSTATALTLPSASAASLPRIEPVLAQDGDEPPPTACPLCGGSNFADFQALVRLQKMAAFAVALTI